MIAFPLRLFWNELTPSRRVSSEAVAAEEPQRLHWGSGGGSQGRHFGTGGALDEFFPGSISQSPGQPVYCLETNGFGHREEPGSLTDVFIWRM